MHIQSNPRQNNIGSNSSKSSGKTFFKNMDIFGLNFQFKADGRENFRTMWGVVFSIIYVCITIGFFFGFGIDLYQRKLPRVSNNSKLVQYEETTLSNENFTFAFRVEDQIGRQVINSSIVNLEVTYFLYEMSSKGQWEISFGGLYPLVRCEQ